MRFSFSELCQFHVFNSNPETINNNNSIDSEIYSNIQIVQLLSMDG